MRRLLIIAAALVMAAAAGSAFAANSLQQGKLGVSVGMGDSIFATKGIPETAGFVNDVVNIEGRYFLAHDMAILAGLGIQTDGGDADASYISIAGGVRKYLKVDDFAPFIDGKLTFTKVKADPNIADLTIIDLSGMFGAEYFLGKQFSLEGAIGIGFGQAKDDRTGGGGTDTYFGTRTVGVRANFYF